MPGPTRGSRTAATKSKMAKKPATKKPTKSKKMAAIGGNGKRPKTNKPKRKMG